MQKKAKFYNLKDLISKGIHYLLMAGVTAGSAILGGPVIFGTTAAVFGTLSHIIQKKQEEFIENDLIDRVEDESLSPDIEEKLEAMCEKIGLSFDDLAIRDFKSKENEMCPMDVSGKNLSKFKAGRKKIDKNEALRMVFNNVSKLHNAAAFSANKAFVMISDPLLDLLDEEEQEAVLAHEMAHIGAKHVQVFKPQRLLSSISKISNTVVIFSEMFAKGFWTVAKAYAAGLIPFAVIKKFTKSDYDNKDDSKLKKIMDKNGEFKIAAMVFNAAVVPVLIYFNPVFLKVYGAALGLSTAANVLSTSLSRSNEYQADKAAVDTMNANPLALVTALRKIELVNKNSIEDYLGGELPKKGFLSQAWRNINITHPATEKRVKRLAKMASKQGMEDSDISEAVDGDIYVPSDHNIPKDILKSMIGV